MRADTHCLQQGGVYIKIAVAGMGARDIIGSTKKTYDN